MRTNADREMGVVLRQYPLHVFRVAARDRGYLVSTSQGTGWLQPWRKRSSLKNYLTVYQKLTDRNSPFPLHLVRTKQRQWAVFTSRRAYTLSRWPEKAATLEPPQTPDEYARWGELLGQLHRHLLEAGLNARQEVDQAKNQETVKPGSLQVDSLHATAPTSPFDGWLRQIRTRRQKVLEVRKEWLEAAALPEEEQLFLRNIPQLIERMDTAIWILEDLDQRPAPPVCEWTLGELSDGFLLLASGEVKLAPWKSLLPGNGLSDLGRLLLSALDRPDVEQSVRAAVSGYERQSSLSAEGIQALLAFLMFPHLLWSLLQQANDNQKLPSELLASGAQTPAKRLPADLDSLREIYRSEQRLRPVYAWLNRQIAERRANKRYMRR